MSSNASHFRLAVVTGAGRGLGLELVRQLAGAGTEVLALCRNTAAFPSFSGPVTALSLDVADANAVARVAERLADRPVDLLINNAALRGATGGLDEVEMADFLSVMAVNALGPLLVTRAFLPHLRAGRGVVANISSRAGSMAEGSDPDGDYAYKCSKAALNMATVKLAEDTGLTVVALHPGWIKTDMGGPEAELDPATSAKGLLRVLGKLAPDQNGRFLTWQGDPVAW